MQLFAVTSDEGVEQDSHPEDSLMHRCFGSVMLAPEQTLAGFCQSRPVSAQRLLAAAAFQECLRKLLPEGFDSWCAPEEIDEFRSGECREYFDIKDGAGWPLMRVWVRKGRKQGA